MKLLQVVLACSVVAGSLARAYACQPLLQERYAQTEKRVRERFDSVDSVELVSLVEAKVVKVKRGGINFDMDAERATFRVDRVFKGQSKPGDIVVTESVSECALSVVGNPKFKYVFDARTGKPVIPDRKWLLYRDSNELTEITSSDLTRPISEASYDLEVLDRWERSARKRNAK